MSASYRIAAATLALAKLLRDQLPGAQVTTLPLVEAGQFAGTPGVVSRVNVWLWRVQRNNALRNSLPGPDGNRQRPAMNLDLHYLITAYGKVAANDPLPDERLLGAVLSTLEDSPILTAAAMTAVVPPPANPPGWGDALLVPEEMSTADLTALFSASREAVRPALFYVVRQSGKAAGNP